MAPIPEKTQVHVDRLLGSKVGDLTIVEALGEGRFSTRYRATRPTGEALLLEVLRLGVEEREAEVRSVDAIRCKGVPVTLEFGALRDGRRYRVLDALGGVPLDAWLRGRGEISAGELVTLLTHVAEVLQVTHAWAHFHGSLDASTVLVMPDGEVKLVDFGVWRTPPDAASDVRALGALGAFAWRGEGGHRAKPPEVLARVLDDLDAGRITDMPGAFRALSALPVQTPLASQPAPTPARPTRSRRPALALAAGTVVVATGLLTAWWFTRDLDSEMMDTDDLAQLEVDDAPQPEVLPSLPVTEQPSEPVKRAPNANRKVVAVPSAEALQDVMWRFERKLRARSKPGDDLTQALAVLNQQRLRLAGTPSVKDRKDVAKKLVGWRLSYLKR